MYQLYKRIIRDYFSALMLSIYFTRAIKNNSFHLPQTRKKLNS